LDIFLNFSISIRFIEKKSTKIIFCISVKERVNDFFITKVLNDHVFGIDQQLALVNQSEIQLPIRWILIG